MEDYNPGFVFKRKPGGLITTFSTLPRPPSLSLSSESTRKRSYLRKSFVNQSGTGLRHFGTSLGYLIRKWVLLVLTSRVPQLTYIRSKWVGEPDQCSRTCDIHHSGDTHRPVFPHLELCLTFTFQRKVSTVHVSERKESSCQRKAKAVTCLCLIFVSETLYLFLQLLEELLKTLWCRAKVVITELRRRLAALPPSPGQPSNQLWSRDHPVNNKSGTPGLRWVST